MPLKSWFAPLICFIFLVQDQMMSHTSAKVDGRWSSCLHLQHSSSKFKNSTIWKLSTCSIHQLPCARYDSPTLWKRQLCHQRRSLNDQKTKKSQPPKDAEMIRIQAERKWRARRWKKSSKYWSPPGQKAEVGRAFVTEMRRENIWKCMLLFMARFTLGLCKF